MNNLNGTSINLLNKSLDYLWKKQSVISNNIANIDTPGYKSQSLDFEDTYKRQLDLAIAKNDTTAINQAIANASITVVESATSGRLDGNNVDADAEMVEMTRTSLQYQYALQSVNSDITRLSTVIKGQ